MAEGIKENLAGVEAALGGPLAEGAPSPHGLAETLDHMRAEVGQLEQAADEPAGALGNHHRVGLGQRLQAGGQVRGLADDGLLARRALADQLADHDLAGGDPDPGRESPTVGGGQAGHCGDDRQVVEAHGFHAASVSA